MYIFTLNSLFLSHNPLIGNVGLLIRMAIFLWIVVFGVGNILLNIFTRGKLASTGIDFIVPGIILAAHDGGILWGIVAAITMVGAHFFSALDKLHNAPFALMTSLVTAIGVAFLGGDTIESAKVIGLVLYHVTSAILVFLLYRKLGFRYLLFVLINSVFTIVVLSWF